MDKGLPESHRAAQWFCGVKVQALVFLDWERLKKLPARNINSPQS
jgi:hypothetical protein